MLLAVLVVVKDLMARALLRTLLQVMLVAVAVVVLRPSESEMLPALLVVASYLLRCSTKWTS